MSDAEFDSKPHIMLLGDYSVGKTTFIRYLLGRNIPGQRIGLEPTTDRFTVIMDGPGEQILPGHALTVAQDLPYSGLEKFGISFLSHFEGVQMPNATLRQITFIDTPGMLSGEKNCLARGYDFTKVVAWFSVRTDLILLLFDAHKLSISDEFRTVIKLLKGNEEKIRCVLNKADKLDYNSLLRVYGSLMWSLGKVVKSPEIWRCYVGSFTDEPLLLHEGDTVDFISEQKEILCDIEKLPQNKMLCRVNELVKRIRAIRIHAYIIGHLKAQMPLLIFKKRKQKHLLTHLDNVFQAVANRYNLARDDFPDVDELRDKLTDRNFSNFVSFKSEVGIRLRSSVIYRYSAYYGRPDGCSVQCWRGSWSWTRGRGRGRRASSVSSGRLARGYRCRQGGGGGRGGVVQTPRQCTITTTTPCPSCVQSVIWFL